MFLLLIPRPFGGCDIYYEGKLITIIRPYLDKWTYTNNGEELWADDFEEALYEAKKEVSEIENKRMINQYMNLFY